MRKIVTCLMALTLAGCALDAPPPASTTPTAAASSSVATPTPTPEPDRTLTVTVSGDLLWHDTTWQSAAVDAQNTGSGLRYDYGPMFAGVKDVLASADIAICHAEVPIAPPGEAPTNYPSFGSPPEVAKGIADAGFDVCTTASNHSWDRGFGGVKALLDNLDANGVAHVGTARSQAEYDKPLILTAPNGLKLGIVEGAYSLNGYELPADKEWAWTPWDAETLLAKAKATRAAGADIVMVAMHGGEEYGHEPSAEQVALAQQLTASPDVNLVYGHHVHVVQPWTKMNGKWVLYGMGNMVAQQLTSQPETYEGVLGRLTFRVDAAGKVSVDKAEYMPLYWTNFASGPIRLMRTSTAMQDTTRPDLARLRQAHERTKEYVLSLGVTGATEG